MSPFFSWTALWILSQRSLDLASAQLIACAASGDDQPVDDSICNQLGTIISVDCEAAKNIRSFEIPHH